MSQILVRDLDSGTVRRLKARAKRHGRSLQGEVKLLLERAAGADREQLAALLEAWDERFAGRRFASSAAIVREDRAR